MFTLSLPSADEDGSIPTEPSLGNVYSLTSYSAVNWIDMF